ncbi:proteasome maturation protein isoform X2 [Panthera uncia]|uniref:proteasome maturation protein isoform X2 n=1 Tax=Panthera uncia TaxID=29064 RepID=UPI0020FFEB77|nr:proteasome maturation protein isoform X2 [Panthera uncia]
MELAGHLKLLNARGLGSQLKDSIPVTELSASGPFESHDLLRKGLPCVKNELLPSHPLELSEKNFQLNQDKMNFSTLRNIQGLFAPLKLQMEFKAVQQVQRLPFLPSSNLSLDILRGNDETIGFEDILNGLQEQFSNPSISLSQQVPSTHPQQSWELRRKVLKQGTFVLGFKERDRA